MESPQKHFTVRQFCERHPAFKEGGLRFQIFNEHQNGLAASGAVLRVGRKVLIHEPNYFSWVEAQQPKQGAA